MSMIERVKEKARADRKTIVFPEGIEERTIQAAAELVKEKLVDPVLLGKPEEIRGEAKRLGVDLTGIRIEDPADSDRFRTYADSLYELRKAKGVTPEKAEELTLDPMYYGENGRCGRSGFRSCPHYGRYVKTCLADHQD